MIQVDGADPKRIDANYIRDVYYNKNTFFSGPIEGAYQGMTCPLSVKGTEELCSRVPFKP